MHLFYNSKSPMSGTKTQPSGNVSSTTKPKQQPKPYCPHCNTSDHYLGSCIEFRKLSTDHIIKWIREHDRCWRYGQTHTADRCTLKKPCITCKELHLTILHDTAQRFTSTVLMTGSSPSAVYLDKPSRPHDVMLKVVKVLLYGPQGSMETYAILDDGSERTMLLNSAMEQLNLVGKPETLLLRTVREDTVQCPGASVKLQISSVKNPKQRYAIDEAFTATMLCLSEYSYPVAALQKRYLHLAGLPLPLIDKVQPTILIGSDYPHLILPRKPVQFGSKGTPVAVCTNLGWSLQGPASILQQSGD